jgi:hypothetical protein
VLHRLRLGTGQGPRSGRLHLRAAEWRSGLPLAIAIFVLLDVTAAQVCKRVMEGWDPAPSERLYRIRNETYHHGFASNVSLTSRFGPMAYPMYTNSLGFRDRGPREITLVSSTPRLLFIGDSFTEGIGVPYEDTFVGLLAERLGKERVDVLNAAVASYGFVIYRRKIEHLLETVGLRFD